MRFGVLPAGGRRFGIANLLLVGAVLGLAACGGGGGGEDDDGGGPDPLPWPDPPDPPAPPAPGATVAGTFRDSAVQGLDYVSGGLSGTTNDRGRFEFASGQEVAFSLGGVTLGSAPGFEFMTPLLLPETGSPVVNQVENIHRFLQLLDLDGNPDNGIVISEAVRAASAGWAQVDFTTTDLPAALTQVIADANAADGTTHVLPSVATANAHFFRTWNCAYNGLYRGTFAGSDSGVFALAVYGTGQMRGVAFSNPNLETYDLSRDTALGVTIFPTFSAVLDTNTVGEPAGTFSGQFQSPRLLSGSWSQGGQSGTWVGTRSSVAADADYRFTGYTFPVGFARQFLSFEIGPGNQVQGAIIDAGQQGVPVALTGTLNGSAITASGGRFSLTGTFTDTSPTQRTLTGTVSDSVRGLSYGISLAGCRL